MSTAVICVRLLIFASALQLASQCVFSTSTVNTGILDTIHSQPWTTTLLLIQPLLRLWWILLGADLEFSIKIRPPTVLPLVSRLVVMCLKFDEYQSTVCSRWKVVTARRMMRRLVLQDSQISFAWQVAALVRSSAVRSVWQKVDEVRSQMSICTAAGSTEAHPSDPHQRPSETSAVLNTRRFLSARVHSSQIRIIVLVC